MGRITELLSLAQSRARELNLPYEGALTPREAHEVLQLAPGARLVDVRTKAEWDWVGRVPGAIEIEWMAYPGNVLNPHFLQTLKHSVMTESLLIFLCRSGQRSLRAAEMLVQAGFTDVAKGGTAGRTTGDAGPTGPAGSPVDAVTPGPACSGPP